MKKLLSKMLLLAAQRHGSQYDKGGQPYILHPIRVMQSLNSDDEELNCMAIGHDLVEDTSTSYEELLAMGFTERIVAGICALTNVHGETYEQIIARISANKDAVLVKLCDLRDNSDIRRLKGVEEKDNRRMAKYHRMFQDLKKFL